MPTELAGLATNPHSTIITTNAICRIERFNPDERSGMRSGHKLIVANIDTDMTQISEEHQISWLKLILRYWPSGLVLPCDSTRQRDAKLPKNVPDEPGTIKSIRTCRSPDIRLTLMLQSQTHHAAVKTGRNEAYRLIHCLLQYCNIRFQLRYQFFMLSNL